MVTTTPAAQRWEALVEELIAELQADATPDRAVNAKAYLKSDLDFLGASVPAVRRAAKILRRQHPDLSHDDLVQLVAALWDRRVHELRLASAVLLGLDRELLTPDDLAWLQQLVRASSTWALVDVLSLEVLGSLVGRYPEEIDAALSCWAADDDFWVRRASLLAYLPELRRDPGDLHRFALLADRMLDEQEFFIRKAIGWVLREVGKRDPDQVVAWLEPRLERASGLTIREAVKYLPEPDRDRLTGATRRRRRS